jgi:hypothetical protein
MNASESGAALLRGRRMQTGKCPDHGIVLVTKGDMIEGEQVVGRVYKCPKDECQFEVVARSGTRLMKLLR